MAVCELLLIAPVPQALVSPPSCGAQSGVQISELRIGTQLSHVCLAYRYAALAAQSDGLHTPFAAHLFSPKFVAAAKHRHSPHVIVLCTVCNPMQCLTWYLGCCTPGVSDGGCGHRGGA